MRDEQEYRRLLDRFLVDDLEDAEVDRFYELVDEPGHPERREELDRLLLVSQGVTEALRQTESPGVVDLAKRRRWGLSRSSAFGLLAAAAVIALAIALWRSGSGPDPGETELPGIPYGGVKGSEGAEGPPLEVKLYLAVRDPDGSEHRGSRDEAYPQDHAVAPMVWCSRDCRVMAFLTGEDGHRRWLDGDGREEILEISGGSVAQATWTTLGERDGEQTITALAWGLSEELPERPEDWLGGPAPDAGSGSQPTLATWSFRVLPGEDGDPPAE